MELVSIVVPLYNAEKYIGETISSVIAQTYKNWELIIVDDCSTDNSIEVIEEFTKIDDRIKLIKSTANFGGPAKPRNIGVENSKGKYIAFLDADDVWIEDKLKSQLKVMQEGGYNFSSTSASLIDNNSKDISSRYRLLSFFKKRTPKTTLCDFIKHRFIATSSVLVEKSLIIPFSEDKNLVSVEDMYVWLRLLDNSMVKYIYMDNFSLKYRILSSSISQRDIKHKQDSKANLSILQFIVESDNFQYIPCFYRQIMKTIMVNFIKSIIGR
ncbi:MAG: glycosyltransferase family 2 protein [Sulfurovum sp.]